MSWLVGVLVVVAVLVLFGSRPSLRRLESSPRRRRGGGVSRALWAVPPLVAVLLGDGGTVAWVSAGTVAAATATWLVTRATRERRLRCREEETARAILGLALLLRAGRIPTSALTEAAKDCEALAPVVATARLGADVPDALAAVAETPGRDGFGQLAVAWRIAERLGAPVASVLVQVADALRAERELHGVVTAELSMARGSARVLALLPLFALGLGFLAGANPLAFLLGHPAGGWLALAASVLVSIGLVWTERLAVTP